MARTINLAVIPGDGIGTEVVGEGLKVLDVVAAKYGVKVPTMRNALNAAFYGRITFKRGRTGGIHING